LLALELATLGAAAAPPSPAPAPPAAEPAPRTDAESNDSPRAGSQADAKTGADPTGDETPAAPTPEAQDRPEGDAAPRRVHLIVDRHHEVGGRVVSETLDAITIEVDGDGERRTLQKARVLTIVDLVDPDPGQSGTVLLRNGEVFRGTILADDFDGVTMEIAGIRSFHPRTSVLRTTLEPPFETQYRELRKAIPEADHVRRLALCQWLFDRKMYEICRDELDDLLESFDLGEARRLRRLVEAQLALNDPIETESDGRGGFPADRPDRGTMALRDLLPNRVLTAEDVNLIRVFEIDFRRPPRVSIPQETIRTLIEENAAHPSIPPTSEGRTRMFRADPLDLVRLMFELKARDLYSEIEVESEPYALNLFRRRVHDAWLIGNCATSRCHGGLDGGRLFLHNRNSRDDRVRFTNLLILLRAELGPQPLVDFERPLDSLVVQHALPRTEARFPHPDVPGWKPVFTNANQRLLADSLKWIESMYRPRPAYPVDYEPPNLRPDLDAPEASGESSAGPTR
jgi:hypothetical protein